MKREPLPRMNYVEIAYARSPNEAEAFRDALRDTAIVAEIEPGGSTKSGVAILVESSCLVRASEVLAAFAQKSGSSILATDDDEDGFEDDDDFSDEDDDFGDENSDDDAIFDDDDDDDDDYEDDDDE